jgi:D-3-phosphoglycerate dehydrogenase
MWVYDSVAGLKRLRGQTLGIVGFGRIGQAVARRASAFGMQVVACDPFVTETEARRHNVSLLEFDSLLIAADIISLHCNQTPDNVGLISAPTIKKMLKRPLLINVARGGLIDEDDLVTALDEGAIAGAGLDVLASEPPDLAASGLVGRTNVILTPHMAFYSDASILENRRTSVRNIRNCLDGNHDAVRRYVHRAVAS